MGAFFSSLLFKRFSDKRILLLGLDAAGKTTILYKLRLGEVVASIPTIGFNVEQVTYKKLCMTVWDVGGQDRLRPLWRHYFQGSDALIFVVDSNDSERFGEARDELHSMLNDDSLRGIPVLILANKCDLPTAASVAKVATDLGLDCLRGRKWYVQASSAVSGDGLYEGLDWLATALATANSAHSN